MGLKTWIDAVKNDSLYTQPVPLGAFIDPEVVMNSLRQLTCRSLETSLDKLLLVTSFSKPSDDVVMSLNVRKKLESNTIKIININKELLFGAPRPSQLKNSLLIINF